MAEKPKVEKVPERIYVVPLRYAWKTPRTRRAKAAATIVRSFLEKHMKVDDEKKVKIGTSINHLLWTRGIQKPPRRVRIHVLKQDGIVYSELIGVDIKTPTASDLKKKADKRAEKEKRIKEDRKERKKMTPEKEAQEEKAEKAKAAGREAEKQAEEKVEAKK